MSRPQEAVREAEAVLAGRPGPVARTYALHALGIVARDAGQLTVSLRYLRRALAVAEKAGLRDRAADVGATLGVALAQAGRAQDALRAFDIAVSQSNGPAAARVFVRLGGSLWTMGRAAESVGHLTRAASALGRAGDALWQARAIQARGLAHLDLGRLDRALDDFSRARELYAGLGQEYEAAIALHNLADAEYRAGRLPAALARYEEAEHAYRAAGLDIPELAKDRSAALLAAGLAPEAKAAADTAVALLSRDRATRGRRADALLFASLAALAVGDPEAAASAARRAQLAFRRSSNEVGAARARLAALRAVLRHGRATRRHVNSAAAVARALQSARSPDAVDAHLVAGQLAAAVSWRDAALKHLDIAASQLASGPALRRATAWYAKALRAALDDDRKAVLRSCGRGLAVLDEHRSSLGAMELRARSTAHGSDLAALALDHVVRDGSARTLLIWSERWRSTLHAAAPQPAPADTELARQLAALRELARRILTEGSTERLERERRRLEDAVRRRTLAREETAAPQRQPGLDVGALLAALGDEITLISVVEANRQLHAVVARKGRLRHYPAGALGTAVKEAGYARFALRGIAARRNLRRTRSALDDSLTAALARIEEQLLGDAVRDLADGPVVLVPPARLQSAPWGALPSFQGQVIMVAPSVTAWMRAVSTQPPDPRRVVLIAGPDLGRAGAEVPVLADRYHTADVLDPASATCDRVLAALDGSWLAHIAAHGTFRSDNPMFSELRLADGPLTVYDLERLRRAPYRLVLSACESGVGAPIGADELLGLSSCLMSLGTVGVLASVVLVDNEATAQFSLDIHDGLSNGASLAAALLRARRAAGADIVARATAYSFVAFGAG
jgi:CHAT domain-containing protein